jgi:quercetin dioxygenase-like cupin family protein
MKIEPLTDEERRLWPKEALVELARPFVDARGGIQPLVDLPMKSAVLITSKAGAIRANHYHKTDWHYCYVVSGAIEYYFRDHGETDDPEQIIVTAGKMVFTPPMVEHAMKFSEDTMFLTLSRNDRDQESYEADVVRVGMIE